MIFKRASVNDVKRMFEHIKDKFSEISSGAASTLLGQNLAANKVLVSDADGKVHASETDANEIVYFYGSSDEVNAALLNGELEVGTNIYCENDTEFNPSYNITEDRAVITNAEGEFVPSDVTATELEYLSGVTGNVQEQINETKEEMGNFRLIGNIPVLSGGIELDYTLPNYGSYIVVIRHAYAYGNVWLVQCGPGSSVPRCSLVSGIETYFSIIGIESKYKIRIVQTDATAESISVYRI